MLNLCFSISQFCLCDLRNLSPSEDTTLRLLLNQGKSKKWKQATTSVGFSQRLLKIQRRHRFRKFLCRNLNAPAPGATRRLIPNTSPIEPGSIIVGLTFYVEADLKCPQFRFKTWMHQHHQHQHHQTSEPPQVPLSPGSIIIEGLAIYIQLSFKQILKQTSVFVWLWCEPEISASFWFWSKAELLDGNRSDKTLEQHLSGTFVL